LMYLKNAVLEEVFLQNYFIFAGLCKSREEISILDFEDTPIICIILFLIFLITVCIAQPLQIIYWIFSEIGNEILLLLINLIYIPIIIIGMTSSMLFILFCEEMPYPYY